jgi:hypothetical protein
MALIKNVGQTDRTIRLAVAGLLILCGVWLELPILSLVGLVVLVTGFIGFCPAYLPFKINTNKDGEDGA